MCGTDEARECSNRLLAGALLTVTVALAGCFDQGDSSKGMTLSQAIAAANDARTTVPPSRTSKGNSPPTISGTPVTVAKAGLAYTYQPSASDADGDPIVFEIRNKPDWATFNLSTGRLEGTPPAGSTGTYSGVEITVSDGKSSTSQAAFHIDVVPPLVGSVELVWELPTLNEDGSPLADLSGYVIRYGKSVGGMDEQVVISNPSVTVYTIDGLMEGTWYFTLSSLNAAGLESRPAGYVSRTIG